MYLFLRFQEQQYYFIIPYSMDIQHFILNHNSYSFQYDQSDPQQVPCDLYDQQSNQEAQEALTSVEQIISQMVHKQGIIDQPMSEIISCAISQYSLPEQKIREFVKKVKKTKNILKRCRAKNRLGGEKYQVLEKKQILYEESSTDKDTVLVDKQIKKQRNRISAQISRDRKKNYVINLEQKNKELAEQSELLKLQNQRLKKEILEKQAQDHTNGFIKNKAQNKFMRLLVLLGIFFFLYILRDMFNFKAAKNSSIIEIEKQVQHSDQDLSSLKLSETNDLADQIKNELEEIEEEDFKNGSGILLLRNKGSLKQGILKKLQQFKRKTKQVILPSKLVLSIIQVKNLIRF